MTAWLMFCPAPHVTSTLSDLIGQFFRREHAVARAHEAGDFVPVGVVVEAHAHDVAKPRGQEERLPGVGKRIEFRQW